MGSFGAEDPFKDYFQVASWSNINGGQEAGGFI